MGRSRGNRQTAGRTLTLQFATAPEGFARVRGMIAYLAQREGASRAIQEDLMVAVGEALTNASRHAYGGIPGPLEIEVSVDDESMRLLIHDHGAPLTNIPPIPPARPASTGQDGGLGLYLIGQLMDEAEIIHPYHRTYGTAIRLVKRLK